MPARSSKKSSDDNQTEPQEEAEKDNDAGHFPFGEPILSCMVLTIECHGKQITTIEGLQDQKTGKMDPLQQAFIDHTAFQCGFCTPGMIMSSKALLNENPRPTEEEVKEALSGNFCRCISHYQVVEAVMDVSGKAGKANG